MVGERRCMHKDTRRHEVGGLPNQGRIIILKLSHGDDGKVFVLYLVDIWPTTYGQVIKQCPRVLVNFLVGFKICVGSQNGCWHIPKVLLRKKQKEGREP